MNIPYPGPPKYPPGDPRNAPYFEALQRENAWVAKNERSFWTGMLIGISLSAGFVIFMAFS